jgi:hypothetical protein
VASSATAPLALWLTSAAQDCILAGLVDDALMGMLESLIIFTGKDVLELVEVGNVAAARSRGHPLAHCLLLLPLLRPLRPLRPHRLLPPPPHSLGFCLQRDKDFLAKALAVGPLELRPDGQDLQLKQVGRRPASFSVASAKSLRPAACRHARPSSWLSSSRSAGYVKGCPAPASSSTSPCSSSGSSASSLVATCVGVLLCPHVPTGVHWSVDGWLGLLVGFR